MKTSVNEGHRHNWVKLLRFTTFDDGHKHLIDFNKKIALPNKKGGHSHKLLNG